MQFVLLLSTKSVEKDTFLEISSPLSLQTSIGRSGGVVEVGGGVFLMGWRGGS